MPRTKTGCDKALKGTVPGDFYPLISLLNQPIWGSDFYPLISPLNQPIWGSDLHAEVFSIFHGDIRIVCSKFFTLRCQKHRGVKNVDLDN